MTKASVGPTVWLPEEVTGNETGGTWGPPIGAINWIELEPTNKSQVGTTMFEHPVDLPLPPEYEGIATVSDGDDIRNGEVPPQVREKLRKRFDLKDRPQSTNFGGVLAELMTDLPNGSSKINPISRGRNGKRRIHWGGQLFYEDDTPTEQEYAQLRRKFDKLYARNRIAARKWLGAQEQRGLNPALISDVPPIPPTTTWSDDFSVPGGQLTWIGSGFSIPGDGTFNGTGNSSFHGSSYADSPVSFGDMKVTTNVVAEGRFGPIIGPGTRFSAAVGEEHEHYNCWNSDYGREMYRYWGTQASDRFLLGKTNFTGINLPELVEMTSDGSEHSAVFTNDVEGSLNLGPFTDSTYDDTRRYGGIFHYHDLCAVGSFEVSDISQPATFQPLIDHHNRASER